MTSILQHFTNVLTLEYCHSPAAVVELYV